MCFKSLKGRSMKTGILLNTNQGPPNENSQRKTMRKLCLTWIRISSDDSDEDSDDGETKGRSSKKQKKDNKDTTKALKPNPFKAHLEEQQKRKQQTQEERQTQQQDKETKLAERKRYYQHRNKERGKMLAKNKMDNPTWRLKWKS
ncbi:unnamed protein product [Absidia cylindrospora]